jgi:hypothetical protein
VFEGSDFDYGEKEESMRLLIRVVAKDIIKTT